MGPPGNQGASADINVTPLIDVLLVLLIIFMVIVPVRSQGLEAQVPQPNPGPQEKSPPSPAIVIQIERDGALSINQEKVGEEQLGSRLHEIFKTRAQKVCFVKAAPELEFHQVVRVIDIAKGAQVEQIGLITAKIE